MNAASFTPDVASTATGIDIMSHLQLLATYTEQEGILTRTYLTSAHVAAASQIETWMHAAGMTVRRDAVGNVIGRYEGLNPQAPALMTGSHFDTVRDAGCYDGQLGIVLPISCIARWHAQGKRFAFPIEVVAFCEEEGVRFKAPMLGSRTLANSFETAVLDHTDESGITMRQAMRSTGCNPDGIGGAAITAASIAAFVEVHIEQGPVLLDENLPVGVVTAIAGATRFLLELDGTAGHAGTVPMAMRQDAAMAAAELALYIEQRCGEEPDLVGTVGQFNVPNGATNVIPGRAVMSIDIRAGVDARRIAAIADVMRKLDQICSRRGVRHTLKKTYETSSVACADWLQQSLRVAIRKHGYAARDLPSGAGHDAMAMAAIAPIAMLFVRCGNGGISHNPAETMTTDDATTAAKVWMHFVEHFSPPPTR